MTLAFLIYIGCWIAWLDFIIWLAIPKKEKKQ